MTIARWLTVASVAAMGWSAPHAGAAEVLQSGGAEYARDGSRVAVLLDEAGSNALRAHGLPGLGVEASRVRAWPIEGWSMLDLTGGVGGVLGAEGVIDALARDAGVRFVSPVFVGLDGGPVFLTPQIIVAFRAGVAEATSARLIAEVGGGEIVERDWAGMAGVCRVRMGARNGLAALVALDALRALPEVVYAEPDAIFTGRGALLPDDPLFPNCWGLRNTGQYGGVPGMDMRATDAWEQTTGAPSVLVVVIDVGVQQDHPDLHQQAGADVTSQGPGAGGPVSAFDNHGTPVAGCVSAMMNNGLGVAGVAPGCRVVSARTFIGTNSAGNWTTQVSWTVDALSWAQVAGRARVTNNSNYYGFQSLVIDQIYALTRVHGLVHFASNGNNGNPVWITYPASIPEVNGVAALTARGELASFSNGGVGTDFAAPGRDVVTIDRTGPDGWNSGDYTIADGTSFASPYAAGVAALVFSKNPHLNALEVELILQGSCRELGTPGYDLVFGWGFVDANAALLGAPAPCPGDANGDRVVNFADLNLVLSNFDVVGLGTPGDVNGDGVVNFADVNLVLSGFNGAC